MYYFLCTIRGNNATPCCVFSPQYNKHQSVLFSPIKRRSNNQASLFCFLHSRRGNDRMFLFLFCFEFSIQNEATTGFFCFVSLQKTRSNNMQVSILWIMDTISGSSRCSGSWLSYVDVYLGFKSIPDHALTVSDASQHLQSLMLSFLRTKHPKVSIAAETLRCSV